MIKKIIKIKNIGKFKNLSSSNDNLAFDKYTLIFGPNKSGKTTFTSLLKSIASADAGHIAGRKTFGVNTIEAQEYEVLLVDGSKYTPNSKNKNQNIDIFDNDFVHKNVFSGNSINKDNKSSLYSILLDEDNIKLKVEIDDLETKHRDITTEKNSIKNSIPNFDYFITLDDTAKIADINKKIEENSNKIKQAENQEKLSDLCRKTKFAFNFDSFEENIKKTIDTTLESKIAEHVRNNHKTSNRGRDFLRVGTELITEKNSCPFCGQSLNDVNQHITDLKIFFGDAYKEVQESINISISLFNEIDVEKEINAFKLCGLEFTDVDIATLETNIATVKNKLKEKQTDLSKDIKLAEDEGYLSIKETIIKLKTEIDKITASNTDINLLREEEKKLNLNRERFSVDGISRYGTYKQKEKKLDDNKNLIDQKNTKLKADLDKLFNDHLVKINEILAASGANFKLAKLDANTNRNLRDHMCEYSFVFDTKFNVDIEGEDNVPNFKNTLSDSDKRVLAFAFYVAKIQKGNNSQNKIIVLDDPFTSLDEDRKDSMINLVKSLNVAQIIILSHNRRFVGRCFNLLPKDNLKTLKLHSNIANGTLFEVLDVQKEILDSEIEKDLSYIRDSIQNNRNLKEASQKVRPCIEQLLKEKYSDFIKPENLSGNASIGTYLGDIDSKCPAKQAIENGYWHDDHHVQNPINLTDDAERLNKLKDFINNILPTI